jgi:hypothetical protein
MDNIKINSKYEILTPSGFQNFSGVKKVIKDKSIKLYLSNKKTIQSSENHKYLMQDKSFKYCKDLKINDMLSGGITILKIEIIEGEIDLYDLLDVENGNIYYGDGVISHNCAFIQNNVVEKIWTSAQQTLGTGGGSIILSTPNGKGNFFHKMWTGAELGENGFNTISLPWYVHPERDDKWRAIQDKQLGIKDAAQECLDGNQIVTILEGKELINITLKRLYNEYKYHTNLIKILTPNGFFGFDKITKLVKDSYIRLELSNGLIVKSSHNHLFISNNKEIFANELQVGDVLDSIKNEINNEIITIKDIIVINESIELYDIVNCKDPDNLFLFNYNIISHNCDCDFSSSGQTVVEAKDLDYYTKNYVSNPIEKMGQQTELWVFEKPIDSHNYIVSADVARGDGGDYSAFHIIDVLPNGTLKQVAEFKGKIDTIAYANLLYNVSKEYNKALLVVENNNIGWSVVSKLIELRYDNLYYSLKSNSPLIDFNSSINNRYDLKSKDDMVPGFSTTSATRGVMLEKMEEYVREKTIVIQSKRTMSELETFIWNGQKAEAMRGYNDDLVMSLAIGIWVRETAFRLRSYGLNLTKSSLSSIKKTGGYNSKTNSSGKEYWNDPSNPNSNLKWLL